ncbi:piggyBac transposable element-derived protein 4-like [Schistocerca cancellata]|uniref:piggyBac transposable element-derived protein 4-like n=1 Tax=Schistocerca cancellata TaxID=274614 RepID=UPI0021197713|nr:piggyBac transposable element-derived protein 4-like [Schistocerca cancellata]
MPQRGDTNYDKLYKLRPFLERISHNFQKALNPNECMAVDESMIKFKGRSSIKQYLPKKPIKRGYKEWVLAEKSGYAWKLHIYIGKKDNAVEKKLGERVVKDLTENIKGKDHRVYFDNYFSSPDLLIDLKENKIHACGTVNPSRKSLPMLKSDMEMKRGDYDWATSNTGLSVMKWKDKRSVHLLSNFHDPTQTTEFTRKEKDGNEIKVSCPIALSDYNANMNCVDKFDQLKGVYETDRKSRKLCHRKFWYFIDATVVNAFIIHKEMKLPKMTLKDFIREIARDLVAPALVASRGKKRSLSSHLQFNKKKSNVPKSVRLESSSHQPERSTRRRCAACSSKKQQIRTDWMCSVCKVPLCLGKRKTCFQDYHAS